MAKKKSKPLRVDLESLDFQQFLDAMLDVSLVRQHPVYGLQFWSEAFKGWVTTSSGPTPFDEELSFEETWAEPSVKEELFAELPIDD